MLRFVTLLRIFKRPIPFGWRVAQRGCSTVHNRDTQGYGTTKMIVHNEWIVYYTPSQRVRPRKKPLHPIRVVPAAHALL